METAISVPYTYVNLNIVVCCWFYWCEFRNREGKQIRWHLRCWIKSSVLPVPFNGFSWERGRQRKTNDFYFFILLFSIVCTDRIYKVAHWTLAALMCSQWQWERQREHSFTFCLSICECKRVSSMNDGDIKHSFHVRFIKTREDCPGHGWFAMSSSKVSRRRKTTTNKQTNTINQQWLI